ncbi:MAG: xanthine dehydrogenase family protein molybdopterin-binding subunit [Rhodospirillaceae bacterium]|nr:xanthine dehydrogenase family protein molybdopterin-binding subunit [Rhodospirillaceae bacterium]
MKFGIGQPITRIEDQRFLTGNGRYVDDLVLPGAAWGYVLRSPHAAARIRGIDTKAASKAPGVLLVLTGADLEAQGVGRMNCGVVPMAFGGAPPRHWPSQPALAVGQVRHVGEPVAFVVAATRAEAEDAAELIAVDSEERRPVVATGDACAPGAAKVWDEAKDNVCFVLERGSKAAADEAFARAAHRVKLDLAINRVAPSAMEPRASAAMVEPGTGRITVYAASQNPHGLRAGLARDVLKVPETQVRVISPDVGGGFGMKNNVFPEDALVAHAARRLGRPVRWTSTRSEGMLSDHAGRDVLCKAELALDADGRFLGLRAASTYALGAYISSGGPVPSAIGTMMYIGTYDIPAVHVAAHCVFTNTAYTGPYRGAGRPEAIHIIERLIDTAARECGFDPVELRRRNFVGPERMPFQSPLGPVYDTGEFAAVLDKGMALADWRGYAARKAASETAGKKRGRGLAYFIETSAIFNDRMELRFDPSGTLTVVAGTHNHGQGHETAYRQMLSDWLGIAPERILMIQGDTDAVSFGRGTYASRSMTIGGSALLDASNKIIEQGKAIAGLMFEAAVEDIEFAAGTFRVAGTDKRAGWTEVVQASFMPMGPLAANGPGLMSAGSFAPSSFNFPNGCHIVEVEVDPVTGQVEIDRYCAVDDSGTIINPLLYAGQIHGGIAQGLGQAMIEDHVYDRSSGQLLTGSFMDYAMPRADDMPFFDLDHHDVPCATNPLGTKGGGESGTVGALPALVNAVVDALADYGVRDLAMPMTPRRIWEAIAKAQP